jgi:hypothetical protein
MKKESRLNYLIEEYDPDLEVSPNGYNKYGKVDFGHSLAEGVFEEKSDLSEKYAEILNSLDTKKAYNSPQMGNLVGKVLDKLERAGMKINNHRKMNDIEKWNYYWKIRRDLKG